jgi:hypothetical protein
MVASTCASGIDVVDAGSGTSGGSGTSASGEADSGPIAGTNPAKPAAAAMVILHRARRAGCGFRGIFRRTRWAVDMSTLAAATDTGSCSVTCIDAGAV